MPNHTHRRFLLRSTMGFLTTKEDLPRLVAEDRMQPVLVRCGAGRFVCPAQDVQHFVDIITKENRDYVRDLCVTTDKF